MTQHDDLTHVWYTRCPVPTASGLAFSLGWLTEALGADGLQVGILQDGPRELIRHHYDHQLIGLFREGGNVPALAAYSEGAPTRLIGLTWIDELQAILVRPDSGITRPEHLKGKRVAMPVWSDTRGKSFPRAMSLHGIVATLARVGLRYDDVRFVEVPTEAGEAVRVEKISLPRQEVEPVVRQARMQRFVKVVAVCRDDALGPRARFALQHGAHFGEVIRGPVGCT